MNTVIVVAGGSGLRMGGPIPKQYLDLAGKPLIIRTLEQFYAFDPGINMILVMARTHRKYWDVITLSYPHCRDILVAEGGETRYDSVKRGLEHVEKGCLVGIHDAVRPLVSVETIRRCFEAAGESGSAIPVIEVEDSIRMMEGEAGSRNLPRSLLRRVQTPQVFQSARILEAYGQTCDPSFTDDASVYESLFGDVRLVEGNRENIKITTPADLKLASLIL
jgi:2-C-methyl-D-erythritol 4-phosphate cytidylyltransferase